MALPILRSLRSFAPLLPGFARAAVPLALAVPSWASAQDVPTLPAVSARAAALPALDRPVSAGSNLGMSRLETPASVDVITRGQLDERGDASLVQAITRAAGVSGLGHPGNSGSSLSARGFTDTTSVMQLYDGMRQYGGVGLSFPFDPWAIERIEVLRGPAAVIHGDGAIGGVVNVVPRKPRRGAVRNEAQAVLGTEDKRAIAFDSSGSIDGEDRWSYRFDASTDRSDGWVDRGESRNVGLSGALQLDVSPELLFRLSHAQGRQKPMRYFGTPLVNGGILPAMRDKNYNVGDNDITYRDRWTDLSAEWSPDARWTVRNKLYHVRSHRHWRNAETYAYNAGTGLVDRSGNTEIAHDQTQTGNTLDATFTQPVFGLGHQVSFGFDVNRSRFQHTNNTYTGSSGPVDPLDPVPGLFVSAAPFIPRYRNEADQYALFLEDRIELDSRWSVVAGVRRDHASISRSDLVAGTPAFDKDFANTGWRLGTVYLLTPDLAVYGQYSKAADPVAGMLMLSAANSAFGPSTGKQVEVGVKQSFWDKKAEWTLAAYEIRKNNLLTRDPADPALRVQVGERSSRGLEATLSMAVTPTLQVDANAALLRARYDDFTEAVGATAVSRNGKVPTDVPGHTANLWVGWKFIPDWTLAGGLRHVGKRHADNANTLVLPGYTTADLSLQWRVGRDTAVGLRGFNVFDKAYVTTAYYTTSQWFFGEGRRVELVLNQRF